jgi:hypothetical protein
MRGEIKNGVKMAIRGKGIPLVFKRDVRISGRKGKDGRIISVGFSRQDVAYRT